MIEPQAHRPVPDARMRESERRLLADALGEANIRVLMKTRTKVDVGQWLRNGRVWACVTESEVILFAAGRVPFVQRAPLDQLQDSVYNHITGEVIFGSDGERKLKRVILPALDGYQLLAQAVKPASGQYKEESKYASKTNFGRHHDDPADRLQRGDGVGAD